MRTDTQASIAELEERIAALPPDARAAAERIFAVSSTIGRLDPPPEMRDWISRGGDRAAHREGHKSRDAGGFALQ